jgi:acetolactate synthase-1/3 small subunit
MVSFQKALNKFGIVQLARTGSIAVKRGEQLFNETESRWKAGVAGAAPTPRKQSSSSSSSRNGNDSGSDSESSYGVYAPEASVDYEEGWGADVLDAAYTPSGHKVKSSTLSIDVQDVPGVLNQVTGVISRRGYNIQSLAVGNAETEGMSRICLVVPGDEKEMSNLVKQLLKLVYVSTVTLLTKVPHVARELMMVKIACPPEKRGEVMDVATIFHGNVCDLSKTTLTMEVVGKEDKMRALQEVLEPYGILEIARTGRVALERESGVDTAYLENVAGNKVHL